MPEKKESASAQASSDAMPERYVFLGSKATIGDINLNHYGEVFTAPPSVIKEAVKVVCILPFDRFQLIGFDAEELKTWGPPASREGATPEVLAKFASAAESYLRFRNEFTGKTEG